MLKLMRRFFLNYEILPFMGNNLGLARSSRRELGHPIVTVVEEMSWIGEQPKRPRGRPFTTSYLEVGGRTVWTEVPAVAPWAASHDKVPTYLAGSWAGL